MSYFYSKMHKIRFRLRCGSAPDPAGGAYSALTEPLYFAGIKGPTSMRKGEGLGWTRMGGKGQRGRK